MKKCLIDKQINKKEKYLYKFIILITNEIFL